MSRALVTIRKARKTYRCSKCDGLIQPGDMYRDAHLPPNSELGTTSWWRLASHVGAYSDDDR